MLGRRGIGFLLSVCLLQAIAGCGSGTVAPMAPAASAGPVIEGHVHGGQQPIAGAHIYLYGVRGGLGGAAYPLLGTDGLGNSVATTFYNRSGSGADSLGTYVITDSRGNFTFDGQQQTGGTTSAGTYACAQNVLVYALSVGGNAGAGENSSAWLMADLGPCTGTTLPSTMTVDIDEISTVAGVYALSGYATGPTDIGYDGSAAGAVGITNASATVANLEDLSSGLALTSTPNGNGTPNAAMLITLANIMGSCINSSGALANDDGSATNCGTLFATATADASPSGTQPGDTITAMLNIAHHPSANVGTLFALAPPAPAFSGGLNSQPNDFTLSIAFLGGGLNSPGIPAVDASGNIFLPNISLAPDAAAGGILVPTYTELSPTGVPIASGPLSTSASSPKALQAAVDSLGNAWFAANGGSLVYSLPAGSTTGVSRPYRTSPLTDAGQQLAIDDSGNVVVNDATTGSLYELNRSGTVIASLPFGSGNATRGYHTVALLSDAGVIVSNSGQVLQEYKLPLGSGSAPICSFLSSCSPVFSPTAIAVDASQKMWVLNNNSTLRAFTPSSFAAYGPYAGGGLNTTPGPNQPSPWLAIDGAGMIWIANYSSSTGTLSEFSSTGAALSPSTGFYGSANNCRGQGLAIDSSGNVWVSCDSATQPVVEYIGLAAPVSTPLVPANFGKLP